MDFIKYIFGVILLMILIELLNLPDWIGRKLRGDISNKELRERINSIEKSIKELQRNNDVNK